MSPISHILDIAEFPREACEFFEQLYKQIENQDDLYKILEKSFEAYCKKNQVDLLLNQLADQLKVHPYSVHMLMLLYGGITLEETYKAQGYSQELFKDTMADLRYKLKECMDVYGIYGTFVLEWFGRFYDCSRFKLGRLQYETTILRKDYTGMAQARMTAYNCHIPSEGPLTKQLVEQSFKMAYDFYQLKKPMIIVCDSWLLFPPHYDLFPEQSNLRDFYNMFHIVESRPDYTNEDMWRIFSTIEKDYSQLPEKTRLQKNFFKYLNNGNVMGSGKGILIYEP